MSRTDKDAPYRIRLERGEANFNRSSWQHTDPGFAKFRKALKRQAARKRRHNQTEKIDYHLQIAFVHWLN